VSIFQKEVLQPIYDGLTKKAKIIPIHLDRIGEVIPIRKSIYTLVGGNTGCGKTSFVDDTYILEPLDWLSKNKDNTDVKLKVLYRSMERSRSLKLIKWTCWKLHKDYNLYIDAETLQGFKKDKIDTTTWELIKKCTNWAESLLDNVQIVSDRCTPKELKNWGDSYAFDNGKLYQADRVGVKENGNVGYTYKFSGDKTKTLSTGEVVQYVEVPDLSGKLHTLVQDDRIYFERNANLITEVIADHIGKYAMDPGGNRKSIIDEASMHMSDFRDTYKFSPIEISQFNRAIGDIQRTKVFGADVSPKLEDFKDTSSTQENSDLVLSLYNANRYKAYDTNGFYQGYNIRDRLISYKTGAARFRYLSILKNSYGPDDISIGLKFLGEVSRFTSLPPVPKEGETSLALEKVYEQVCLGF